MGQEILHELGPHCLGRELERVKSINEKHECMLATPKEVLHVKILDRNKSKSYYASAAYNLAYTIRFQDHCLNSLTSRFYEVGISFSFLEYPQVQTEAWSTHAIAL